MVSDALSWLSMGSVSHIKDNKTGLVWDVHRLARLGVQLIESSKGGVIVHSGLEYSFLADVKLRQGLNSNFVELKEVVLKMSVENLS